MIITINKSIALSEDVFVKGYNMIQNTFKENSLESLKSKSTIEKESFLKNWDELVNSQLDFVTKNGRNVDSLTTSIITMRSLSSPILTPLADKTINKLNNLQKKMDEFKVFVIETNKLVVQATH